MNYAYGTTQNNGNVLSQTITIAGGPTLLQSYTYDQLNRLQSAQENGGVSWKQTYLYDRYGNRTFDANNTTLPAPLQNPTINSAHNRINANQGYGYDTVGNLTSVPNQSFTYDAENRMVSYNGGNPQSGGGTFSYDGDGRRVKKIAQSGTTIFVYNALGQMVAEYTDNLPPTSGGTSYLTADHLGTPRIVTDATGSVKARHDYLPFGEEIQAGVGGRTTAQGYVSDSVRQKWVGKEFDGETGLSYFGARYMSSAQGRFTSIDPGPFMPASPQSWNRYAYVENNPLKFIDPTGRKLELGGQAAQDFVDYLKKRSGGLDLILKNGKVTIGKNSTNTKDPAEKAFRDVVKKVIGASETVKWNVERDAPNNLVDDTVTARSQNRTAVADFDDIETIDKQAPSLAAALTAHFLYEGLRFAQGSPSDVGDPFRYGFEHIDAGAHINALALEAKIMSAFTGKNEGKIAEHRDVDYQSKGVTNFIYTTVQFDLTYKSGATPNSVVVDKVTQTTPIRKPGWPPGP